MWHVAFLYGVLDGSVLYIIRKDIMKRILRQRIDYSTLNHMQILCIVILCMKHFQKNSKVLNEHTDGIVIKNVSECCFTSTKLFKGLRESGNSKFNCAYSKFNMNTYIILQNGRSIWNKKKNHNYLSALQRYGCYWNIF